MLYEKKITVRPHILYVGICEMKMYTFQCKTRVGKTIQKRDTILYIGTYIK